MSGIINNFTFAEHCNLDAEITALLVTVYRRMLSIKMAVFMDGVCKSQLLSTKRAAFMDKM